MDMCVYVCTPNTQHLYNVHTVHACLDTVYTHTYVHVCVTCVWVCGSFRQGTAVVESSGDKNEPAKGFVKFDVKCVCPVYVHPRTSVYGWCVMGFVCLVYRYLKPFFLRNFTKQVNVPVYPRSDHCTHTLVRCLHLQCV